MHFETTERIFAFPLELVEHLPSLIADYGVDCMDGKKLVRTIAAGWDDTAHTRVRGLYLPLDNSPEEEAKRTASLTALMDGRSCYSCLWPVTMIAAWQSGNDPRLVPVQEITAEQLEQLRYIPEIN